jgi:hypothetical protein
MRRQAENHLRGTKKVSGNVRRTEFLRDRRDRPHVEIRLTHRTWFSYMSAASGLRCFRPTRDRASNQRTRRRDDDDRRQARRGHEPDQSTTTHRSALSRRARDHRRAGGDSRRGQRPADRRPGTRREHPHDDHRRGDRTAARRGRRPAAGRRAERADVRITAGDGLGPCRGLLVGVLVGTFGGLYPAWRAAHVSPARVLAEQ